MNSNFRLELCKEAAIDSERRPSCVNVIIKEPNMGIRITSGYLRGYYLSRLIQIYTKFDPRLLKLIRLFRFFAKVRSMRFEIERKENEDYSLGLQHRSS